MVPQDSPSTFYDVELNEPYQIIASSLNINDELLNSLKTKDILCFYAIFRLSEDTTETVSRSEVVDEIKSIADSYDVEPLSTAKIKYGLKTLAAIEAIEVKKTPDEQVAVWPREDRNPTLASGGVATPDTFSLNPELTKDNANQ